MSADLHLSGRTAVCKVGVRAERGPDSTRPRQGIAQQGLWIAEDPRGTQAWAPGFVQPGLVGAWLLDGSLGTWGSQTCLTGLEVSQALTSLLQGQWPAGPGNLAWGMPPGGPEPEGSGGDTPSPAVWTATW